MHLAAGARPEGAVRGRRDPELAPCASSRVVPRPLGAVNATTAVPAGEDDAVGDGVVPLAVDHQVRPGLTHRGLVPGITEALGAAFVSAEQGWVVDGPSIEATTDGGRSWEGQLKMPQAVSRGTVTRPSLPIRGPRHLGRSAISAALSASSGLTKWSFSGDWAPAIRAGRSRPAPEPDEEEHSVAAGTAGEGVLAQRRHRVRTDGQVGRRQYGDEPGRRSRTALSAAVMAPSPCTSGRRALRTGIAPTPKLGRFSGSVTFV